jgi:hypothetical protein
MRKLGLLVALPLVGALLGISPAAAQPTPEVTAFCTAGLTADKAANKFFSTERPSRKARQEFEAALAGVESTAPPEVAANVQAVANEIRSAIQRRKEPSERVLEQNLTPIDEYRYNSCGYQQVDVTGVEYEFQGLPETLPAGVVAFRFTDTGAELHEMDVFRIKSRDSLRKILGLSEKEASKKVEQVGNAFAEQNETTYLIADLSKPGRYGVVCHLPVGSTSEREAERRSGEHGEGGTPHWRKGMRAEITVQAA